MMPQMDPGSTGREQQGPIFDRYEAGYNQQPYSGGSPGQSSSPQGGASAYDDDFIESLAQRLSQRMAQGPRGKVFPKSGRGASAGQRLALAIVSLVMLVPTTGILFGVAHDPGVLWAALIGLGAVCLTVMAVNAIFNDSN